MASKKNILDSFGWFLEKLKSNFVKKSGDTMTGPLTISKTEIKNNDAEPADKITVSLPKESGTLMIEPESVTKNYVYAGPSSANGKPEFRRLFTEDMPDFYTLNFLNSTGIDRIYINCGLNLKAKYINNTNITKLTLAPNIVNKTGYGSIALGSKQSANDRAIYNTNIIPNSSENIDVYLPSSAGTLALKSDIPNISLKGTNNFSGENTFISTYMRLTTNNSVPTPSKGFIIDAQLQGQNVLISDVYPAIWFRNKNLSEKNMCCLAWNTDKNYLAMYDQKTGKTRNLALKDEVDESINSLNAKINASIVQLVATTTTGTWMNFNVPSLAQYRYIIFCINDGNMSQFPPVIYPISVFKTCNSINRTAMLSEYGTIKCYACYNNDTQVGLYIGGSGRQITVYGIQ